MSDLFDVDITFHYRNGPGIECAWTQALDDRGVTVLLGPSGSGKTTLFRCLTGLERPQRGHIKVGARVWFDAAQRVFLPADQRNVGLLFQDYALFPHMTVEENIAFGAPHLRRDLSRRRVNELLEMFRLHGLERRTPRQLSGGEQQRVALARAVCRRPRLLFLDEPLSALDAVTREDVREELRRLLRALEIPTYLVTHNRLDALSLGDRTVLMDSGKIIQIGSTREVFANPETPIAARLVGIDTVLIGQVTSVMNGLATVYVAGRTLRAEAPVGGSEEVALCIRAEDVLLARRADSDMSAMNQWPAIIEHDTSEGPFVRVSLNCGFPLSALVTRDTWQRLALHIGDEAVAMVKATSIRVLPRH